MRRKRSAFRRTTGLSRSRTRHIGAALHALILGAGLAGAPLPVLAQPRLVDDGQSRAIQAWAPKGLTQSPVAICFDPKGNLYVAESDRAGNAVQDTRQIEKLNAVEEDLRFRSVEDRRAQIRRWTAAGAFPSDYFTRTEDRVRILSDTDGDGVADRSRVFAGGFNGELDGIGAGLLWQDGTLYYTCIPNLWALRDTDGNLETDDRTSLSFGYGVRWCFFGHDLHGLTAGPDGRIYFSMGDRGYNVTTREGKHLVGVDRGGVFRCWPDGSELELFYQGLRNPQELAFNELGDLFTGDNNCDSGDLARVVHVVEGGDSGWRQDVQSLDSRGPWNRESMWKTVKDVSGLVRPAWSLPPVEYMCAGPSGMALYPGTGESHAYDGCFFLVDFYGSGSTIHTFRCVPQGAGFTVADHVEYYKGVSVTDIAWGPDSRLYMSDWGGGWQPNPNGNVITVTNTTVRQDPAERAAIEEVGEILRSDSASRSGEELIGLLYHRDQRVRLVAQYELAKRGSLVQQELEDLARAKDVPVVARAHAIWAIGQIARSAPQAARGLAALLNDTEAEIRVQATRTLGDLRKPSVPNLSTRYAALLKDPSARVRAAAAIALGKSGDAGAVRPLLDLLAANQNEDLVIRHAGSYALSLLDKPEELLRHAESMNDAARLGAVMALRLLEHPGVAGFLDDSHPAVAIEAARAIYDLRIQAGMPGLAAVIESPPPADRALEPLMRRAIEANVLLGTDECADRLAAFAALAQVTPQWRALALERLEGWDRPLKREGVWGNWADLPARPVGAVQDAVNRHIDRILSAAADNQDLIARAYHLQARHAPDLSADEWVARVVDASRPESYRVALLDRLAGEHPDRLGPTTQALLTDPGRTPAGLRRRAQEHLARADPDKAVRLLVHAAANGDLADRQHVVKVLGSIPGEAARAAIANLARSLRYGSLDPAVALDVYQAATSLPAGTPARSIAEAAGKEGARPAGYATTLLGAGGNPGAGREIFLHHGGAECLRCHTIDGLGGTAGPDLSKVASRLSTGQLVESLVEPGAVLAPGFGQVSAMPAIAQFLSPHQVRDVVAYLQTLQKAPAFRSVRAAPSAPGLPLARIAGWASAIVLGGVVWRCVTRRPLHGADFISS